MTDETPESELPEPAFRPLQPALLFASAVLAGIGAGLIKIFIF